mgnify:CR=1 FL=1
MPEETREIRIDFENQLKKIEKNDKQKSALYTTCLFSLSVLIFLMVLTGTIMSYNNYMRVKNQTNNSSAVLEL